MLCRTDMLGHESPHHRRDFHLVGVLLDCCPGSDSTQPAPNADDLALVAEERSPLLHLSRDEEHAVGEDAVNGRPKTRHDAPIN